eukprot:TRINITY_DN15108_c0_g1_i1.p1 TRINITY_DN15108_c0_g1~~TRINITY_DN15108_c0_g1_i1.p1  ORF type:complete len:619 (+),score=162.28 TRINITY_DN15108_c0_g1_i1:86-1858(+)
MAAAVSGQDVAIKKALEAFRKDLMPVLQVDMKMYLISEVKAELGAQMRDELRKEMKQLTTKLSKDMTTNSESMKEMMAEQVKKIEQDVKSASLHTNSMKVVKAPVKTRAGARKSVAAAVVERQRKAGSRKPVVLPVGDSIGYVDTTGGNVSSGSEAFQTLLSDNVRKLEMTSAELPPITTEPVLETEMQVNIDRVLNHEAFDIGMAVVILIGAIMMGVSLQYGIHDYLSIYDLLTAILFTAELAARFYCYGSKFFTMEGHEWNIFDLAIVICQLTAVISQTGTAAGGLKSLRGLRGLRAIRSLRVLRTLRLLRFVEEFRGVIISMLASLKSTVGVLCLFTFGLYLFGACIASEVLEQKRLLGEDQVNPLLVQHFGNLTSSMLFLYESVTGGLSWSVVMSVFMEEEHYMMAFAFSVFIALCVFVLLNVLTAIFTGQAILALHDDQDAMIIRDIDMLFRKGDLKSGDITWDEFQGMLSVPEMVHLFKALNIDISEARHLFHLLDTENVGVVDYNEFLNGCLRLRGPAKSLELVMMMKDTSMMNTWTEKKLNMLGAEMQSMQFSLSVVSQQLQALATPPAEDEMTVSPTEPAE